MPSPPRSGCAHGMRQVGGIQDQAHTLSAAPGHGLDEQRESDRVRDRGDLFRRRAGPHRFLGPRDNWHAGALRREPRGCLAPHRLDGIRRRSDEGHSGVANGCRKVFVLRQEPVARMHGVDAGPARRVHDAIDVQVALARRTGADRVRLVRKPDVQGCAIAFGVNRDGSDAHLAARTDDPHRDLAAVCHQNLLHLVVCARLLYFQRRRPAVVRALFVCVRHPDKEPFGPRSAVELKAGRERTVPGEAHRDRDGREAGARRENWLLSPAGVFRSPIRRGRLLQVG